MDYLNALGIERANYDKAPFVDVSRHADAACSGWRAIGEMLGRALEQKSKSAVVTVECYPGVFVQDVINGLKQSFPAAAFYESRAGFKDAGEIDKLVAPFLGDDDPVFGYMTCLRLEDFLDATGVERLREEVSAAQSGVIFVVGEGASLVTSGDVMVYADMPRWEIQQRQRRNEISNLGVENAELKASMQYKRAFFVDWRVCDKRKRETMDSWDFLLDTTYMPRLVSGEALRDGLRVAVNQPFRVVPFFDPGVWGGQWMKQVCDLEEGPPNYAWCFDCVPEENSLLLRFGETMIEIPSLNLVYAHPRELLGEPVYGRFGAEFPIRFDFLDTMEGENLSFQVHPLTEYIQERFGMHYTQDESYYILDAGENAKVYLGHREGVSPDRMLESLESAKNDPSKPFDDKKYVASWEAKKHDHFLIPAGTLHCSGANTMALEISATPYIFTFKLWDWGRLGMDGLPRPINIEHGRRNIQWHRDEEWVRGHLVNAVEKVGEGAHWTEERTGLHEAEFIETRRHRFTGPVEHDTQGIVNVLNLVEGKEAVVTSPEGVFEPFVVHYAETFIVPAAVGRYTISPGEDSTNKPCATMKAFVRVNS
mgnify:CR=1 FL=1